MDDIADLTFDGTLCKSCGEHISNDPLGVPEYCGLCSQDNDDEDLNDELIGGDHEA